MHRITGHDQLFDTVFVYENYPIDTAALSGGDGLVITDIASREYYHYPLAVQAVPGQELSLRVQYRHRYFRRGHHRGADRAVEAGVGGHDRRPARRLSSIDLLDAGEHARLDGWGNRAVLSRPAPAPVSIPVVFAAQVARSPEAVALNSGRSVTYGELDEAANRLAHLLSRPGCGPG